jgi:hypothetical protein
VDFAERAKRGGPSPPLVRDSGNTGDDSPKTREGKEGRNGRSTPMHERLVVAVVAVLGFASFAAPARAHVVLNQPNGGENLTAGTNYLVIWTPGNEGPGTIDLYLATDGGTNFSLFHSQPTAGNGVPENYGWTVPNVSSTTCKVKVIFSVLGGGLHTDTSANNFTIQAVTEIQNDAAAVGGTLAWSMLSPAYPAHVGVLWTSLLGGTNTLTLNPGNVQIQVNVHVFTVVYLANPAISIVMLDGTGSGAWAPVPVPNNPLLVNLDVWSAAAVFHLPSGMWKQGSTTAQVQLQ